MSIRNKFLGNAHVAMVDVTQHRRSRYRERRLPRHTHAYRQGMRGRSVEPTPPAPKHVPQNTHVAGLIAHGLLGARVLGRR